MAMLDLHEGILSEFAQAQSFGVRRRSPEVNDVGVYRSYQRARALARPWSSRSQKSVLLGLISDMEDGGV